MPSAGTKPSSQPFVVALTGGIASGKTAVSDRFAALGVPVIDTDVIAHLIVEPGKPALNEIQAEFGPGILLPDGQLNRRKLRELIFSDPARKKSLEGILHPAIRKQVLQDIAAIAYPYCLVVIPLFTETGAYEWVNRVLVIDTDETTQVNRVMERDKVSEQQARAALASQALRSERLALADDVIENNGKLEDLDAAVSLLHTRYLELANSD